METFLFRFCNFNSITYDPCSPITDWLLYAVHLLASSPQTLPKTDRNGFHQDPYQIQPCSRCTVLICNFWKKKTFNYSWPCANQMWVFVTLDISKIKRTILEINSLRYNHQRMRSERQKDRGVIYVISPIVSEISHKDHEWKLVLGRSCFCTIVKVLDR